MEVVYINIKIEKRNGEWGGGYKLKHPLWGAAQKKLHSYRTYPLRPLAPSLGLNGHMSKNVRFLCIQILVFNVNFED